jgi:hypothetical protein
MLYECGMRRVSMVCNCREGGYGLYVRAVQDGAHVIFLDINVSLVGFNFSMQSTRDNRTLQRKQESLKSDPITPLEEIEVDPFGVYRLTQTVKYIPLAHPSNGSALRAGARAAFSCSSSSTLLA